MILYNGQLKILYDMMCRKEHLMLKYEELLKQREITLEEINKLQKVLIKEQADVKNHEYGSLAAFFLNVILKKDQKLNEEKEKSYAATVKYDAARRTLQKVEEEIIVKEKELSDLEGCEEEYEQLLLLKKERMKSMGHGSVEKVLELEHKLIYFDNQIREVETAIEIGRDALGVTQKVLEEIGTANQCGICNFARDSFLTNMFVYSKLIDSQCLFEKMQHHLRRFITELSDLNEFNLSVSENDFLKFSDEFFENVLNDWMGLLKGERPREQVQGIKVQILVLLEKLESIKTNIVEERKRIHIQLEKLIVQVNI